MAVHIPIERKIMLLNSFAHDRGFHAVFDTEIWDTITMDNVLSYEVQPKKREQKRKLCIGPSFIVP